MHLSLNRHCWPLFYLSRPGSQERLKGVQNNLKGRIDFTRQKFQTTWAWVIYRPYRSSPEMVVEMMYEVTLTSRQDERDFDESQMK